MNSFTRLTCPVTGRHIRVPFSSVEDGVFAVVEPDDDSHELPEGWGRLVLEISVPNPEVVIVAGHRDQEVAAALEELRQTLTREDLPKGQREQLQTALDLGTAERDIREAVEERNPGPDDLVVTARSTFPVLSLEALRQAVEGLSKVGFKFSDPDGVAKMVMK